MISNMDGKKVCLFVTGASRGIGRSIAKLFAQDGSILDKYAEGSKVILMARDQSGLEDTKALITNPNINVSVLQADLSSGSVVENITRKALEIAGDGSQYDWAVFFHNAGSLGDVTKSTIEFKDFGEVSKYFDLNLNSLICQTGLFCEHFKGVERLLVNISSMAALKPFGHNSLYCTGKAARHMFLSCVALEFPDISVLNYGAGPCATEMTVILREQCGNADTRGFMQKLYDENTIIQVDTSMTILAEVIKTKAFKSGDFVDYYDRK